MSSAPSTARRGAGADQPALIAIDPISDGYEWMDERDQQFLIWALRLLADRARAQTREADEVATDGGAPDRDR